MGGDKTQVPIRFGSYNIRNGQDIGLESVLRGMDQANLDMGVLWETNLTYGVYTHGSLLWTCRSNTAKNWQCSTNCPHSS